MIIEGFTALLIATLAALVVLFGIVVSIAVGVYVLIIRPIENAREKAEQELGIQKGESNKTPTSQSKAKKESLEIKTTLSGQKCDLPIRQGETTTQSDPNVIQSDPNVILSNAKNL